MAELGQDKLLGQTKRLTAENTVMTVGSGKGSSVPGESQISHKQKGDKKLRRNSEERLSL